MMKLTSFAAALVAVAAFSVPVSAEYLGGGPRVSTDGKCWKDNAGPRDGRFGTWVACPKKASASDSTCRLGQLAWEKLHEGLAYFDNCTGVDQNGKPIGGAGAAANASASGAAPRARASR